MRARPWTRAQIQQTSANLRAKHLSIYTIMYAYVHVCRVPYGQLKRKNRHYTFPKTFSFELRFWHNFVPDMPDSSEKLSFQGPPILGAPHCKCNAARLAQTV